MRRKVEPRVVTVERLREENRFLRAVVRQLLADAASFSVETGQPMMTMSKSVRMALVAIPKVDN